MYFLYGHPKNFKFKQKSQQYGPCFQTISPFLMTMILLSITRMLNYVKNQITTKLGMLNRKETPDLRDNFTKYKKKILLYLAKSCSIKWVKLLPHMCNKFGRICHGKFKVCLLKKVSHYTATIFQDFLQDFDLIKVGLSSPKKLRYLLHWKLFKNDEERFLFHLKSSFLSQDI